MQDGRMPKANLGWGGASSTINRIVYCRRVIRTRDLVEWGVPPSWLWVLQFEYERMGRGLYVVRGDCVDPLIVVARKYPRLTVGLMTALWLHGVLTERPENDWWIMGLKDRMPLFAGANARFLRSSWPHEDRVELDFDRTTLLVHSRERALLDCVKFRRQIGEDSVRRALRVALETGAVVLGALESRAEGLQVVAPLRELMRRLRAERPFEAQSADTSTSAPDNPTPSS
jgi:hypothetical protein